MPTEDESSVCRVDGVAALHVRVTTPVMCLNTETFSELIHVYSVFVTTLAAHTWCE